MSRVFLVESPFQLLSAIEARDYYGNGLIIIRYSNLKENDIQLKNLIKTFNIDNYLEIKIDVKKSIFDILKTIYLKIKVLKYKKIFIGNLESGIFKIIIKYVNRDKITLLDDGAKTIYLQESFSKYNYYNLFTMFKLNPINQQKIDINNFTCLKSKFTNLSISDKTIFIGSKISEINLISQESYLDTIFKLSKKYSNFVYIPHREESIDKLNKISDYGIEIEKLDLPIELIGYKYIPKRVISFYSTALISLKRVYSIDSRYIKLDNNSEILKKVYLYYSNEIEEEIL